MADLFSVKEQKQKLRIECRNKRRDLSEARRIVAASQFTNFVREHLITDKYVMSFCSFADEIDTCEANELLSQKQLLVLPQIEADTNLIFPIHCPNYYHKLHHPSIFKESPLKNPYPRLDLNEIKVILIPGLAFDPESKHRLGYGKGHYDRFLKKTNLYSIKTIGIGFLEQSLVSLPTEAHDVPLSEILFF